MNALVTGGAGFIGSNLVKELLDRGHNVVVLDSLLSGYKKNIESLNCNFIEGDITKEEDVKRAFDGNEIDTVFHLAASVGNKRSIDFPISDSMINVIGTLNVLEEARKRGVKKIVASSSAGIYGELKTLPIVEDHPIDPESPYAASKLCMEKHCLAYGKLNDIEVVCLRYFNVYGPNQRFDAYGNVIPKFVFLLLDQKPITIFGDGEQTRDFINVHDVVQANIKAATTPGASGAYNCASGTQISINGLVNSLDELCDLKGEVIYGDLRLGDVKDSLANISAANKSFGFKPTVEIDNGLMEYVKWAREEYENVNQ
jgi:nucleoside-diphosphate-sugar epimerase